MTPVPQVLKDARVYREGNDFLARAKTIKLPSVKHITAAFEGLGTGGPMTVPVPGLTESLDGSIMFVGQSADIYELMDPRAQLLDCRASQTAIDPTTGLQIEQEIRAVIRAMFNAHEGADQERAKADGPTFSFSALYLSMYIDNKQVLEIDKLSAGGVCRVLRNGVLVDLNARTREIIGT